MRRRIPQQSSDPQWYKDAVFYELRVRSFFDGNGDGIGDFVGLTEKLDYLEDLGITAIWLLPFYPSPMRDDGYDIADYCEVHPDCGTLDDFKRFLDQAHRRDLRVVTELVLNHTSDQHPWFRRAREAPAGHRWRRFYVWSDTTDRYPEARIIFKDFERSNWTWDPVAKAYFWHRFYSHQPDLNYDNSAVRQAMLRVLDFWLDLGVDGLRLDAIPYLFEREGTSCENLPETHEFLRALRFHVDSKYRDRMLLAEANQWPEDAVAYLGDDKCHMAFHFPIMPRLFMALHMEDRFPITDIVEQTPELPESCQWALFLRNHDELTLEMVTDEERDYMYRAYARERRMRINLGIRRRLAPLLGHNRRTIELLNGLLFSLPGTPCLYYGDELGMGDNLFLGDRDGVRTPMQWSADRNAGFSRALPHQLILPAVIDPACHYETVNVESEEQNRHSLLWWMRRLIALNRQHRAFGRGTIEFLHPDNPKVLAFLRCHGDERILVVANLSRFAQCAELDLGRFQGWILRELFGHTEFPRIGPGTYPVTLSPHGFHWFSIEPLRALITATVAYQPPQIDLDRRLGESLAGAAGDTIARALPDYLYGCRWFAGKARRPRSVEWVDALPFDNDVEAALALARVNYFEGDSDTYAVPLAVATDEAAWDIQSRAPEAVVARVGRDRGRAPGSGLVVDALYLPQFSRDLLRAIGRGRQLRGLHGMARAESFGASDLLRSAYDCATAPHLLKVEQSNSSVVYGDLLILKSFRRLDEGLSPEVEMTRHLSERGFAHSPPLVGYLEYRPFQAEPITLAVLQRYLPHQSDAWLFTLDELRRFFERVAAGRASALLPPDRSLGALIEERPPTQVVELIGLYLDTAGLLGQRTADLHLALATETADPGFAPEPFTPLYRRGLYQSLRTLTRNNFRLLRRNLASLDETVSPLGQRVLALESRVLAHWSEFVKAPLTVRRIRGHGDLHLGQVLYTGKDFVFIDFEGEPARPLADRRRKRSALFDVAGMIRSFHYAANTALREQLAHGTVAAKDRALFEQATLAWASWVASAYLRKYRDSVGHTNMWPTSRVELDGLLGRFLLEKAIYELGYELEHRPDWVAVPLTAIEQLLVETAHP
ncbi:MAG: maltose alpha-D-glucosyltransferase [Deltaproteobacteria bacterium]|nr:maltose alpha-D-glucosyltransferase [Deltaproteobacteria bacterium]